MGVAWYLSRRRERALAAADRPVAHQDDVTANKTVAASGTDENDRVLDVDNETTA